MDVYEVLRFVMGIKLASYHICGMLLVLKTNVYSCVR